MAHSDSHHPPPSFRDDSPPIDPEATFSDYAQVLIRRKRLIAVVVAISVVAGALHALLVARTYSVQTAIEIGRVGGDKLIDPPETILAKMTHAYIPDAIREHRASRPDDRSIKISAKIPKGSEVVVLESRSRQAAEATYRSLQQGVADRLIRDHRRTIDQIVKQYESDLSRATIRLDELTDQRIFTVQEKLLQGEIDRGRLHLASLKDQSKLVEMETKRLDDTKKLLTQQVADVKAILAAVSDRRAQAVSEVTDEARAMTLLLLDSQMVDSRSRLGSLEERLYISLENERETRLKQMADIRREQAAQASAISELGSKLVKLHVDREREQTLQQQAINDIQVKLTGVRPTQTLLAPTRSLDPVGVGRAALVALYALLGLMAGVFSAFAAEFMAPARTPRWPTGNGVQSDHPETEVEAVLWETR